MTSPPTPAKGRFPMDGCSRCSGTGEIAFAGRYVPRDRGPERGPCIRCRTADFCEAVGLTWEARRLRNGVRVTGGPERNLSKVAA
jgi:hypothetical protein